MVGVPQRASPQPLSVLCVLDWSINLLQLCSSQIFFLIRRPRKIGSLYGVLRLHPHCISIILHQVSVWTDPFAHFGSIFFSSFFLRSNLYPSHRALGVASPRCFIIPAITVSGPLCPSRQDIGYSYADNWFGSVVKTSRHNIFPIFNTH